MHHAFGLLHFGLEICSRSSVAHNRVQVGVGRQLLISEMMQRVTHDEADASLVARHDQWQDDRGTGEAGSRGASFSEVAPLAGVAAAID
jgi:hypothetical protein